MSHKWRHIREKLFETIFGLFNRWWLTDLYYRIKIFMFWLKDFVQFFFDFLYIHFLTVNLETDKNSQNSFVYNLIVSWADNHKNNSSDNLWCINKISFTTAIRVWEFQIWLRCFPLGFWYICFSATIPVECFHKVKIFLFKFFSFFFIQ